MYRPISEEILTAQVLLLAVTLAAAGIQYSMFMDLSVTRQF